MTIQSGHGGLGQGQRAALPFGIRDYQLFAVPTGYDH